MSSVSVEDGVSRLNTWIWSRRPSFPPQEETCPKDLPSQKPRPWISNVVINLFVSTGSHVSLPQFPGKRFFSYPFSVLTLESSIVTPLTVLRCTTRPYSYDPFYSSSMILSCRVRLTWPPFTSVPRFSGRIIDSLVWGWRFPFIFVNNNYRLYLLTTKESEI